MSLVKSKDTKPEVLLRSYLHQRGLRFRLHKKELPGKPDIIFPKFNAVIFVHGCFWHGHKNPSCKLARIPKTNVEYWSSKIESNRVRDDVNREKLIHLGWRVLTVWECSLKVRKSDLVELIDKIIVWLNGVSDSAQTMLGGKVISDN